MNNANLPDGWSPFDLGMINCSVCGISVKRIAPSQVTCRDSKCVDTHRERRDLARRDRYNQMRKARRKAKEGE